MLKAVSLFLCSALLFCACGKSVVESSAPDSTQTEISSSVDSSSQSQVFDMIEDEDFEVAEYKKFNSPASENGLGGTKITFQGTIKEIKQLDAYLYYIVAAQDGDWSVGIGATYASPMDSCEALVGQYVQLFAEYQGFSEVFKLPACNLMVEGQDGVFDERMRVVDAAGTVYPYVPYFWDWNLAFSSEEGQAALGKPKAEESTPSISSSQDAVSSKTESAGVPTTGERNALNAAKAYLDVMPFSYTGLIDQLEYEGYTSKEATYAADKCGADWNAQAVKAAKAYLENMSFSRQGLIDQLKYEGYTQEQAAHGATENGY